MKQLLNWFLTTFSVGPVARALFIQLRERIKEAEVQLIKEEKALLEEMKQKQIVLLNQTVRNILKGDNN